MESAVAADWIVSRLRDWVSDLFVAAVRNVSKDEDRLAALRWLAQSRDILASERSTTEKMAELHRSLDAGATVAALGNAVVECVKNYKNADMPLAVKVSVPVTLLAAPFLIGHGAGVVALGSAVGMPVLLIVFLGTAGLTSILEAFVGNGAARSYIGVVAGLIARDEALRRVSAALKDAMQAEPAEVKQFEMPEDEAEIRSTLLAMDPFDFERHVMNFFKAAGMEAWVTRKSNDMGVDGFAKHPDGLIVVQCKRNALDNRVGRPKIQEFKGVIEENGALKGWFVTTSGFSQEAVQSAALSDRLSLVALDELVAWHRTPPVLKPPASPAVE
jgi:hypothetical protein